MSTVVIDSPSSNTTISATFTASGEEGGVPAGDPFPFVTGKIDNGSNMVLGNTTQQPTAMNRGWTIQFSNVPSGNDYTLTVQSTDMAMAQVGGLTV
jgi:hypothetical protein